MSDHKERLKEDLAWLEAGVLKRPYAREESLHSDIRWALQRIEELEALEAAQTPFSPGIEQLKELTGLTEQELEHEFNLEAKIAEQAARIAELERDAVFFADCIVKRDAKIAEQAATIERLRTACEQVSKTGCISFARSALEATK